MREQVIVVSTMQQVIVVATGCRDSGVYHAHSRGQQADRRESGRHGAAQVAHGRAAALRGAAMRCALAYTIAY